VTASSTPLGTRHFTFGGSVPTLVRLYAWVAVPVLCWVVSTTSNDEQRREQRGAAENH
jgi:hypothetical protein